VDQGIIASLLQHPLASALVIVDRAGRPLAANPAAREHGLPATVAAYAPMLEDLRLMAADGGIVACTLPGGPRGHYDGHLRAVHDGAGNLLAFTLSIPEPVPVDGGGRWELALDSAGHSLWDWDIPSDRVARTPALGDETATELLSRVHGEDIAQVRAALDEHLRGHSEQYSAQFRFRQADGQWRWLEMNARPRFSRMGRFIGLAGSSPDVTERREIELAREELLQSERAARSAAENMARLKDEFLATLSHELRTPLTTILGWSELLLQRVDNTSPLYKGLNVIANSAGAQKRLISDMLDLSSMLLGKVQLEVEVLDLRTVLGEAIGAQELVAEGKALDVHLQLPEQPSLVLGDATRLQQVFWNLLSNAIKFTPAEGRIDLQLRADGNHWEITVRDTGDGIAPEFLNHLFSRFRQADGTTTRRHGGLGLGLAIVQQLVELHGGTVAAASEGHGHGATFTVRLPQHLPDAERRPLREVISGPILEPVIVEPYPLRGMHVLAVEDQPEVLEYLRRMLEEQGASVSAASSAGEALALLADTGHLQYHVMLTDIGMPGMDGYGLVRTLREDMGVDATTLPAVAVTALARADDRRRALASGFQEHVAKPYSVAQLVAAVRKVQVPRADSALH